MRSRLQQRAQRQLDDYLRKSRELRARASSRSRSTVKYAALQLDNYIRKDKVAMRACRPPTGTDTDDLVTLQCQRVVMDKCEDMLSRMPHGQAVAGEMRAMAEVRPFPEVLNMCHRAAATVLQRKA